MKYCPLCRAELEKKLEDGIDRLCCSSGLCAYVYWNNPTPVVAAIVEIDQHIVLARNKSWPKDMFGLITGFLEKGETPEAGILREVKEELGLNGTSTDFVGNYSFFEMNQIIIAFHVKAKGTIEIGAELSEIRLVRPEDLQPWEFGTGLAIKDWLEKDPVAAK